MLKKALVITSKGLGDGLLMMIASERLKRHGYQVVTLNDHLPMLSTWFPGHHLEKNDFSIGFDTFLSSFDLVLLQNDNTEKSKTIFSLHQKGVIRSLSVFFSSYEPEKHPPLTSWDIVFDSKRPMVENISKGIARLLRSHEISSNNGLAPPSHLTFRNYENRVIIHPTASESERMWPIESYLKIATKLKKWGLDPVFSLSAKEKLLFEKSMWKRFFSPTIHSLNELATLIYESGYVLGNESGVVHLASNLLIPNLTISGNQKRIQLWRPGWLQGIVITPFKWIPNFKFFRTREKYWKYFIHPLQVEHQIKKWLKKTK